MIKLETIDIVLLAVYFISVFAIGFHFSKKHASSEDYFLAGRKLGWFTIGFSLFASNISSTTLVGLSGAAYKTGISISNYEWMAGIILVFFAIYFVPYYIGSRIYTMPEFLEKRFNSTCRYYFSIMTIVGNLFIDTAGTLFAGALVIQFFFPGIEIWQSAMGLAFVAGIYTAAGGLSAVVYTDVIQAIILLIGSTAITFLAFEHVGSWENLMNNTPSEMLSLVRPVDDETMPWLGLITGVPILGFYFWCTNQFIVQRVLGAKDIHNARWGAILGGFLKLPVLFIMVFPGLMARYIFPELDSPDLVFPTMVSELLPVGIRGLVLAGLVAAIMSSIDSTLHSASTLVTMDFVKKAKPNLSAEHLTKIGRRVTVTFMIVSALWTPVIAQFETLFEYLQSALAYLVPPIAAVFLLGLFWKKASSRSALTALISVHIFSLLTLIANNLEFLPQIHFLIWAGIFFGLAILVMVFVSIIYPEKLSESAQELVWSRASMERITQNLRPVAWYQDYRLYAGIVLFLTGLIIVFFY